MRRLPTLLVLVVLLAPAPVAHATGVCFPNASDDTYLRLVTSRTTVEIANQIAIVTTTQTFRNDYGPPFALTYGFPMPETASATQLSWDIGEGWVDAVIEAEEEAEPVPGESSMHPALEDYLGPTPLLFTCPDCIVEADEEFSVRLTYVQLLPYRFGKVDFEFPNHWGQLRAAPVDTVALSATLDSPRTIQSFELLSHEADEVVTGPHEASLEYEEVSIVPTVDYHVQYELSLDELGLFSMSALIPPEEIPDDLGGFFTFVAEPESNADVIEKVFTLIIDHSGSMLQLEKIQKAKEASSWIVENLNQGDRFNIVDFGTEATSMSDAHVPASPEMVDAALGYIDGIIADYWDQTNISGAFELAVPQFSAATDSTANIIVFFTDGRPNGGIEDTDSLLVYVHDLIELTETRINLHTMGIGANLNLPLITLLASQNRGTSVLLGEDEIVEVMTTFYQEIRNPVLIDTEISFSPAGIVDEVYPETPPNLFVGSQMIVSGRYLEAGSVDVTLSGTAFGEPVVYTYQMPLAATPVPELGFLPKIWAKAKIEQLMIVYRTLDPQSDEALAIRDEVIALSVGYGVVGPFTTFSDDDDDPDDTPVDPEIDGTGVSVSVPYVLLGNRPNPFNPRTRIEFAVGSDAERVVVIRIYDALGRLVRTLTVDVAGSGVYSVVWDGRSASGRDLPSGAYLYAVDFGDAVLTGKMMLIR